jgi:hypothetical protein
MKMQTLKEFDTSHTSSQKSNLVVRRALNYAFWSFGNFQTVKMPFVENASKSVFDLLKIVPNTNIEMNCLFIYWILHEMLLSGESIDKTRIEAGIENVLKIARYFNIEIQGTTDKIATIR